MCDTPSEKKPTDINKKNEKVLTSKKKQKFRKIPAENVLNFVGTIQPGPTYGPGGCSQPPRRFEGAEGATSLNYRP